MALATYSANSSMSGTDSFGNCSSVSAGVSLPESSAKISGVTSLTDVPDTFPSPSYSTEGSLATARSTSAPLPLRILSADFNCEVAEETPEARSSEVSVF